MSSWTLPQSEGCLLDFDFINIDLIPTSWNDRCELNSSVDDSGSDNSAVDVMDVEAFDECETVHWKSRHGKKLKDKKSKSIRRDREAKERSLLWCDH